jgi:hypothetical protein
MLIPQFYEQLEVSQGASWMGRLLSLDSAWTYIAEQGEALTPRDRSALVALGYEIDAGIAVAERHAWTIGRVASRYPEWVNEQSNDELPRGRLTEKQLEQGRLLLGVEHGDYAGATVSVTERLTSQAAEERRILSGKLEDLREDGPVSGDLSKGFLCNLAAGGYIAGLIGCAGSGCLVSVFCVGFAAGAGC